MSEPGSPSAAAVERPTGRAARTRQRIKDATARVLSRRGYAGTRMLDIATAAGLQVPNIYYYFTGRDELIDEVMRDGVRGIHDQVAAALGRMPPPASPRDRLAVAIEAHLRSVLALSDYATASTRNAGQLPDHVRAGQLAEERRYAQLWRGLVAALDDAGGLAAGVDRYTARMLILGALNWTPEWWRAHRGDLERLVAATQRSLLDGIVAGGNGDHGNGQAGGYR